jgi:predicted RNA-binding Zn-ribbon protein involved in translation (DUF1610 family)
LKITNEITIMKSEPVKLSRREHHYWIEGLAVALGLLGLALILAPDRLRNLLFAWVNWIKVGAGNAWVAFNHFLDQLTLAKLVGFALLAAVAATFAWRQRNRLATSEHFSASACPACGGELHRIHRSSLDRLAGRLTGIPLRRYRCSDRSCGWQGLLRRRERLRGSG